MSVLDKAIVAVMPLTPKPIVGLVSRRYIAGTTLTSAVEQIRSLNNRRMMATMDLLGENITRIESANEVRNGILEMLDEINRRVLNSNVSVKPTQLGLQIDFQECFTNFRTIIEKARSYGNFVRIDMEDSSTTDATLELYRKLRSEGFENVGVVIQAYLRRSETDIKELAKLKANVRICKGIYVEPASIAFQDKQEVRENFLLLLNSLIENRMYVGIATHDDYLVENSYRMIEKKKLDKIQYEFQMLLGVKEQLRNSIVTGGHRLRVYVPFGEQWYAYCMRRLRENPQIAGYVFKAMFNRVERNNFLKTY
jgi:proline dehydrogenase